MDQLPAGKGYALWLMPGGPAYRDLARKILALSRRHSTPRFEPHITLLSGIGLPEAEAIVRAAVLAQRLTPFEIRLAQAGFTDEYFRCIFLRVLPVDLLASAHAAACKIFNLRDQHPYMPHVSLLYGNLPFEVKKRIASRQSTGISFKVSRLHLYSVNGPPAVWRQAGTFSLG